VYTHFHWRFPAPPALEASGNETTAQAVQKQPPVMLDIFILLNIYIYIDIGTTKPYWMVFKYSNI
jgi:hypothetical protein